MRPPKPSKSREPLPRGGSWDEMPKRAQIEGFRPAWGEMPNLEAAFAAGNKFALMLTIYKSASRGQPLPAWAALGYMAAFRKVYDGKSRSWNDEFGLPRPTSKHIEKIAPRRALSFKIYNRIQNRKSDEPGIGPDLFGMIGREFGKSRKETSKLYYEAKATIERPFVRNPEALAEPETDAIVDDDFLLHHFEDPDPLLDCDDPDLL